MKDSFPVLKIGLIGFRVTVVRFTFINPGHLRMGLSCRLIPIVVLALICQCYCSIPTSVRHFGLQLF